MPQKMARLAMVRRRHRRQRSRGRPRSTDFVFVDQEGFEQHKPKTFAGLAASFTEYQGD